MQIFLRICARIVIKYNPFLKNVPFCIVQHVLRTKTIKTYFISRKATKSIYILCIYIVKGTKMTKNRVYHMGILWVWYGYPMVREAEG